MTKPEPTQADNDRTTLMLADVRSKHHIAARHLEAGTVTCNCGAEYRSQGIWKEHLFGHLSTAVASELAAVRQEAYERGKKDSGINEDMAHGIFDEIRLLLSSSECMHGKDHGNTPPMMFAEWIQCVAFKREKEAHSAGAAEMVEQIKRRVLLEQEMLEGATAQDGLQFDSILEILSSATPDPDYRAKIEAGVREGCAKTVESYCSDNVRNGVPCGTDSCQTCHMARKVRSSHPNDQIERIKREAVEPVARELENLIGACDNVLLERGAGTDQDGDFASLYNYTEQARALLADGEEG